MSPHRAHRLSAVPRELDVRLEIMKAIHTLFGPGDDAPRRQRQKEIAALRRDLEAAACDIAKIHAGLLPLLKAELRSELKKYRPDQPRAPRGHSDGGQWTKDDDGAVSPATSADRRREPDDAGVRYAETNPKTFTDATGGSGGRAGSLSVEDTQHDLSNLYHALVAAGRSLLGTTADHFGSHYFDIKRIGADELPSNHPRAPVPFVDSSGDAITVDGKQLLRPISLPPELYVQAGISARSWAESFIELKHEPLPPDLDRANAQSTALATLAVKTLLPLAPGGPLDAERFDWTYVRDYRRYQNIMIGVYGAAAGMSEDDVLSLVDLYASWISNFPPEVRGHVYTNSARQDVADTKLGYRLYRSGRIRS